jgi:hypothetical protein
MNFNIQNETGREIFLSLGLFFAVIYLLIRATPLNFENGFRPFNMGFHPFNWGFRPLTIGFRPFNLNYRPLV